jgi:hypothetical protein
MLAPRHGVPPMRQAVVAVLMCQQPRRDSPSARWQRLAAAAPDMRTPWGTLV